LNQKQIEAAVVVMRIFLAGLAFNFDADFHELEEVTKRALLEIETEAFPEGEHDDEIDACSGALNVLTLAAKASSGAGIAFPRHN
jgi:hypothetical protein